MLSDQEYKLMIEKKSSSQHRTIVHTEPSRLSTSNGKERKYPSHRLKTVKIDMRSYRDRYHGKNEVEESSSYVQKMSEQSVNWSQKTLSVWKLNTTHKDKEERSSHMLSVEASGIKHNKENDFTAEAAKHSSHHYNHSKSPSSNKQMLILSSIANTPKNLKKNLLRNFREKIFRDAQDKMQNNEPILAPQITALNVPNITLAKHFASADFDSGTFGKLSYPRMPTISTVDTPNRTMRENLMSSTSRRELKGSTFYNQPTMTPNRTRPNFFMPDTVMGRSMNLTPKTSYAKTRHVKKI
jgi:hypothetical protein